MLRDAGTSRAPTPARAALRNAGTLPARQAHRTRRGARHKNRVPVSKWRLARPHAAWGTPRGLPAAGRNDTARQASCARSRRAQAASASAPAGQSARGARRGHHSEGAPLAALALARPTAAPSALAIAEREAARAPSGRAVSPLPARKHALAPSPHSPGLRARQQSRAGHPAARAGSCRCSPHNTACGSAPATGALRQLVGRALTLATAQRNARSLRARRCIPGPLVGCIAAAPHRAASGSSALSRREAQSGAQSPRGSPSPPCPRRPFPAHKTRGAPPARRCHRLERYPQARCRSVTKGIDTASTTGAGWPTGRGDTGRPPQAGAGNLNSLCHAGPKFPSYMDV